MLPAGFREQRPGVGAAARSAVEPGGSPARRNALLVAGGLGIAAAFLDGRAWPLAWLGLAPLFAFAPRADSPRAGARYGLLAGLATNVPAFWWLVATIHRFGGFPLPIALGFYAVLAAFGALQFALVGWLLARAGPSANPLLAPALWTAAEFLYPNLFPWRLACSQRALLPLLQIGELTGPFGLSFAMAWTAAGLARRPFAARHLRGPAVAVAAILAFGAWRMPAITAQVEEAPAFSVGVVQGNLRLDEKRHAEHLDSNVARYRRLSGELPRRPDLLVWPETVVEWGIPRGSTPPPAALDPFPDAPSPLLFGAVSYERRSRSTLWYNSAYLRQPGGELLGPYDKLVLMPFGEFIPFASFFPRLKDLSPQTGDFQAGRGPVVLEAAPGARVGPLICYEDLLAGHVRRTVAAGATVLAAIANDAWFGDTAALRQHESLALWRAIENRRFLVRATNTGLTAVIDPLGRSILELPVEREAAALADTRLLSITTVYGRFGDLFAWAITALAAGLLTRRPAAGENGARTPAQGRHAAGTGSRPPRSPH